MKKKITAIILSLMIGLMGFAFAGCGDNSVPENTEETESSIDTSMFMGTWAAHSDEWGDFALMFDKTGIAVVEALDSQYVGNWEANKDGTITVTTNELSDIIVSEKDGQLSYEFSGDTIVFDKCDPNELELLNHTHDDGENPDGE